MTLDNAKNRLPDRPGDLLLDERFIKGERVSLRPDSIWFVPTHPGATVIGTGRFYVHLRCDDGRTLRVTPDHIAV